MFFNREKTKDNKSNEPKELADVLDKHLSTYVKVVNVNNSVKTAVLLFGLTGFAIGFLVDSVDVQPVNHIAEIEFSGVVSSQNKMASAAAFAEQFQKAIKDDSAKAILILAASGGGSPVQAEMINEMILNYRQLPMDERKEVIVSVQEVCASACIMAFSGADKIYTHANSLIGSISVRMDGWAIDKALANFDVKRKVISPGKYKDLFDPYKSISDEERQLIMDTLLQPMHNEFVESVKLNRGEHLDLNNNLLFTGMAWSGVDGVQVGLADEVKTTFTIEEELKSVYAVEEVRRYNQQGFSFSTLLKTSMQGAIESVLRSSLDNIEVKS